MYQEYEELMSDRTDDVVKPWIYASGSAVRAEYNSDGGVKDEFGDWIEGMAEWRWFVTRTLRDGLTTVGFTKPGFGVARAALRDLVVHTQASSFVSVFEMQHERGVPHLHALLAGCRAVVGGAEQERDYLLWGMSRYKVYSNGGGASRYLGKYLTKDISELYIGHSGPYTMEQLSGTTVGGTRL